MNNNGKKIVLIGFSASGKTTVGKIVAQCLNLEFCDTDSMIESQQGLTIAQIFEKFGEQYFRKLEMQIVAKLPNSQIVVACGGGLLNEDTYKILKDSNCIFVWLNVRASSAAKRLAGIDNRPLLRGITKSDFEKLFESRQKIYQQYADIIIDCDNLNAVETSQQIISRII